MCVVVFFFCAPHAFNKSGKCEQTSKKVLCRRHLLIRKINRSRSVIVAHIQIHNNNNRNEDAFYEVFVRARQQQLTKITILCSIRLIENPIDEPVCRIFWIQQFFFVRFLCHFSAIKFYSLQSKKKKITAANDVRHLTEL